MSSLAAEGLRIGLREGSHNYELLSEYDANLRKLRLCKFGCALHLGICVGTYLLNYNKKISALFALTTSLGLGFIHHYTQRKNKLTYRVTSILTELREDKRRLSAYQFGNLHEHLMARVSDVTAREETSMLFSKLFAEKIKSLTLFEDGHADIGLWEGQQIKLHAYDGSSTLYLPKNVYLYLGRDGRITFPNVNCAPTIEKSCYLFLKTHFTVSQVIRQEDGYKVLSQKITPLLQPTPHIGFFDLRAFLAIS